MTLGDDVDLMGIGTHCSHPDCHMLDFLPFKCSGCAKAYCSDHRTRAAHECSAGAAPSDPVAVVVCPVCARGIRLGAGQDANAAFEAHSVSPQCDPSNYARVMKKRKCPVKGCRESLTTINQARCRRCSFTTCLKHRLPEDHQCAVRISHLHSKSLAARAPAATPIPAPAPAPKPRIGPFFVQKKAELCDQCGASFATVTELIEHSEAYHRAPRERAPTLAAAAAAAAAAKRHGLPVPAAVSAAVGAGTSGAGGLECCPHCGEGFGSDAVALVAHVERCRAGAGAAGGSTSAWPQCVIG